MRSKFAHICFAAALYLCAHGCSFAHDTEALSSQPGAGGADDGGDGSAGLGAGQAGGVFDAGPDCGNPGQKCCGLGCAPGATCNANSQCETCGSAGQPCCGLACVGPGLTCSTSGVCLECGKLTTPCCDQGKCDFGGVCVGAACVTCGETDTRCCEGDLCNAGKVCVGGICKRCGQNGDPCCDGPAACSGSSGVAKCCTGCTGNSCSCDVASKPGGQCRVCCAICTDGKTISGALKVNGTCFQAGQQFCNDKGTGINGSKSGWSTSNCK